MPACWFVGLLLPCRAASHSALFCHFCRLTQCPPCLALLPSPSPHPPLPPPIPSLPGPRRVGLPPSRYELGVVPVVWGWPEIDAWAPRLSAMVHISRFPEPAQLVAFLLSAASNATLFRTQRCQPLCPCSLWHTAHSRRRSCAAELHALTTEPCPGRVGFRGVRWRRGSAGYAAHRQVSTV